MTDKHISLSCANVAEDDLYGAYKIFFGTLVSGTRLKILNELREGKRNVTELTEALGLEQSAVSHDLARLRRCGFVRQHTQGKFRYYEIDRTTIEPMLDLIDAHMSEHCIHILEGNR